MESVAARCQAAGQPSGHHPGHRSAGQEDDRPPPGVRPDPLQQLVRLAPVQIVSQVPGPTGHLPGHLGSQPRLTAALRHLLQLVAQCLQALNRAALLAAGLVADLQPRLTHQIASLLPRLTGNVLRLLLGRLRDLTPRTSGGLAEPSRLLLRDLRGTAVPARSHAGIRIRHWCLL